MTDLAGRQDSQKSFEVLTSSAAETIQIGKKIAAQLAGGQVVAIIGDLGTGKTHLVKGIAAGLGVPEDQLVTSPTFILVNEYYAMDRQLDVFHIDAYRLNSVQEFEALGVSDYCRPDSIVLIEWADKVWPAVKAFDPVVIRLAHLGGDRRQIILPFSLSPF